MKIITPNSFIGFTFLSLILFFYISCSPPNENLQKENTPQGWIKVFKNDAQGNSVFGNKENLINAVRNGLPIRIGWGGRRVEHVADAGFLTIGMGKEVFAQIETILGQQPDFSTDTLKLGFRVNNKWTKIAGTNGYNSAIMVDYINDTIVNYNANRQGATTWYVNYNSGGQNEIGTPLWHESSTHWEAWKKENN